MDVTIKPLSPHFGAEISGANVSAGGDNVALAVRQAWLDAGGLAVVQAIFRYKRWLGDGASCFPVQAVAPR